MTASERIRAERVKREHGATLTRTRQSIGSQLRETLNELVGKDWINGWRLIDGTTYVVTRHGLSTTMNPGEAMAFVNSYGYDVRFGKS